MSIPPGAYEIESLNKETERTTFQAKHSTGANYPFTNKPNLPTLGSFIKTYRQEPLFSFTPEKIYDTFFVSMQAQYTKMITYHLIQSTSYQLTKFSSNVILLKQ